METAELAVSTSSDLSIFGLFLAADLLVKSVMILLVTASIWSWSIMIQKTRSFQKKRFFQKNAFFLKKRVFKKTRSGIYANYGLNLRVCHTIRDDKELTVAHPVERDVSTGCSTVSSLQCLIVLHTCCVLSHADCGRSYCFLSC